MSDLHIQAHFHGSEGEHLHEAPPGLPELPPVQEALAVVEEHRMEYAILVKGDDTQLALVIDPNGKAVILQCLLSNKDLVRHLRYVASWAEGLSEEMGFIRPGPVGQRDDVPWPPPSVQAQSA